MKKLAQDSYVAVKATGDNMSACFALADLLGIDTAFSEALYYMSDEDMKAFVEDTCDRFDIPYVEV